MNNFFAETLPPITDKNIEPSTVSLVYLIRNGDLDLDADLTHNNYVQRMLVQ